MNILNILLGILLFFLIILVHEFGHFTVAKLCKMKVKEFAIGMGPKLFKKRIGGNRVCVQGTADRRLGHA